MNNKTLVTILIVGAVAAGGYYLYRQQKKQSTPAPPQNPNQANPAIPQGQDPTITDYINGGAHVLEVFKEEFGGW